MIKLNHKITIITVFLSIIITLLVGLISIIISMYVINKEASANLLLLTQNKTFILEDSFKQIEITSEALANYVEGSFSSEKFNKYGVNYIKDYTKSLIPLIKSFIVHTDKAKGCYFNFDPEIVKSNKVYETWVYDKTETHQKFDIVTTEPMYVYSNIKNPSLAWLYKPKATGKPAWSDPYVDQTIHVSMISYTKPVYIKDKFIGVAGMDMSIEKLEKIISKLKVYETGYAFLLDNNLNIIFHKNNINNEDLKKINNILFKSLKNNNKKNIIGIINYKNNSIEKVACYKQLNNGLILVITAPRAEILRQKLNLRILVTGITLLSLILAILIMFNKK